jgi:hypothetical protein
VSFAISVRKPRDRQGVRREEFCWESRWPMAPLAPYESSCRRESRLRHAKVEVAAVFDEDVAVSADVQVVSRRGKLRGRGLGVPLGFGVWRS